jgi:hypothetical protein
MTESKLDIILILEIMGKPAEYLKVALSDIIDKLSKEPGVSLINKKIAEPKLITGEKDVFSSFAEIEIAINDIRTLTVLMFNYMPAHVEITNPESLIIKNYDLNVFFNELVRRLHQYDEIAKISLMERTNMMNHIQSLQKQLEEKQSGKEKKIKEKKPKKKKN